MDLNRWIHTGYAGRWVPRRPINFNYLLESSIDDHGLVHYRAKNIKNNSIITLKGRNPLNFVEFDDNPERNFSSSFPMKGFPPVLSNELPGWFYVKLNK